MALTLVHATPAQLAARLRERYREARGPEAWRLAHKLYAWYQAGDITASQIRNVFNLDAAQFAAFATRVQTAAAKYEELLAARGE